MLPSTRALDQAWLQSTANADKNRQLEFHCEKVWIHHDDLARFEQETGFKFWPIPMPFDLK